MENMQDKLSDILSDPKAMARILDMVRSLSPSAAEPKADAPAQPAAATEPASAADGAQTPDQAPDMGAMLGLLGLLGGSGGGQPSSLVDALKPYLSPRRAQSLIRARQLSGLIRAARSALGGFLKGGGEDV